MNVDRASKAPCVFSNDTRRPSSIYDQSVWRGRGGRSWFLMRISKEVQTPPRRCTMAYHADLSTVDFVFDYLCTRCLRPNTRIGGFATTQSRSSEALRCTAPRMSIHCLHAKRCYMPGAVVHVFVRPSFAAWMCRSLAYEYSDLHFDVFLAVPLGGVGLSSL